jgi:hypothetical protein
MPAGGSKYGGAMYGGAKYGVNPAERQPTAGVEEQPYEGAYVAPAQGRKTPFVPGGLVLSIGGGITDFAGTGMRSITQVGGEYEVRLMWGSRSPLAIEAAYVGTAQAIRAVGMDPNAILVSNGVEGIGRLNIGTWWFQPYIFGGVGWQHFNVTNKSFNVSDVQNVEDAVTVPWGGGFAAYIGNDGWNVDFRVTYRSTFSDHDMVLPGSPASTTRNLANYSANLRVGYEF